MRRFFNWAQNLRFRQLFLLTALLFALDLAIPDVIPLLDELVLGLLTLVLGSIKKKNRALPGKPR